MTRKRDWAATFSRGVRAEQRQLAERLDGLSLLSRVRRVRLVDNVRTVAADCVFFRACCGKLKTFSCCLGGWGQPNGSHLRRPENRLWCAIWTWRLASWCVRPITTFDWPDFELVQRLLLVPEEPLSPLEMMGRALDVD